MASSGNNITDQNNEQSQQELGTIIENKVKLNEYETAPYFFSIDPKLDIELFVDFCFTSFCIKLFCVFVQVSLTFLVRPTFHSSIAHLFILEWFVPIFIQVSLI